MKATQCKSWKHHKEPYGTLFLMYKQGMLVTDTQTHKMTTVTPAVHARWG